MRLLPFLLVIILLFGCKEAGKKTIPETSSEFTGKVEVVKVDGTFALLVNKEPFYIKGAGLEFGDIEALAKHGGNSFRTWRTNNGKESGMEVLDRAHQNGLMVTMGIEMGTERHGFDYNDVEMVREQKERVRQEVLALKDHPALLIWSIGNELNLNYSNPKVWDAVNDIAIMIHELDGNHPTTTTLAGISQKEVDLIKSKCPDLEILSIQMYGDLPNLPVLIKEFGWEGPYMVTEWGATGHWEVPTTNWGAPIEENSTVKANNYLKRFQGGIAKDTVQCLGSYVFLWGNKQERTPTWYGIFMENGNETEAVDVMHFLWNRSWPENRSPKIEDFTLNGKTAYQNVSLQSGETYTSIANINDEDHDSLEYIWDIMPESTDLKEGGDHEKRPKSIKGLFLEKNSGKLIFKTPETTGAYRLFVYANDGNKHTATANIPFYVN